MSAVSISPGQRGEVVEGELDGAGDDLRRGALGVVAHLRELVARVLRAEIGILATAGAAAAQAGGSAGLICIRAP